MTSETTHRLPSCNNQHCKCQNNASEDANSNECFSSEEENNHKFIAKKLHELPKIKARVGFDQRMAAAFAMELQQETKQRNRSWLKKHPQISLPDISTNLAKYLT